MKFLSTLGYLFLSGIQTPLGSKLQKLQLQEIRGGHHSAVTSSFIQLAIFLTFFVQFWLLTRMFPVRLIGLLVGAWFLAIGINAVIGAIAGFTLPAKKEKITTLAFILSMQRPARGCGYLLLASLVMMASAIGSLWVFWSHPTGDPRARVWIAIFQFLLPQLVVIPSAILVTWPIVTSEFMDDDFRNASLANSFSFIIFQTLYLFFPIWLLRDEMRQAFGESFQHLWLLLSVPLLAFMLGSLLPFLIGIHRYRSQCTEMLRWKEEWLQHLYELVQLPVSPQRNAAFAANQKSLNDEIQRTVSQHRIHEVYKAFLTSDEDTQPAGLPASVAGPPVQKSPITVLKEIFQKSGQTLGAVPATRPSDADLQSQIGGIVEKYHSHLREWDIGFAYLGDLLELQEVSASAGTADLGGFVKARQEGLKKTSEQLIPRSNVLAGGLMTALSSAFVFLFKQYQTQIFDFVGHLVRYKA